MSNRRSRSSLVAAPPRTAAMPRTARRSVRLGSVVRALAIAVVVILFLFPFVWMVLASFKQQVDITSGRSLFVFAPTLQHYRNVLGQYAFHLFILNSLIVAALSTLFSLVLGLPAAYAIARFRMPRVGLVLLVARIIPGIAFLIPWFILFSQLRLVGTYTALVLSHMLVGMPFVAWVMISFFEGLPIELEEAAQVDGLTRIGAFRRIALPLSMPGIITGSILAFIFSWNNFMFSVVLAGPSTRTSPVAIFNFISYATIDWGGLMAASVVITLPVVLIALFVQRYIISGLTAGATKG